MISVQVYVSRDLKRWRQVESRLPLGRLDVHGQTLEILDLPAQAVTARYLLILPAADAKLFAIKEVLTREQPSTVTLTQKTRLSGRWTTLSKPTVLICPVRCLFWNWNPRSTVKIICCAPIF